MRAPRRADDVDLLDLLDPADRARAAAALAEGAAVGHSFGNITAITARPDRDTVVRVNRLKGRPDAQAGSVVTTPDRVADLFDWSRLPPAPDPILLLALMAELVALGPIGFRGAATAAIPEHLTVWDGPVRTVQVVSPGSGCPSNLLVDQVLADIGGTVLFGTSANVSHHRTGRTEPPHVELRSLRAGLGAGLVLIGHRNEGAVRDRYPLHRPCSTSIVSFHNARTDGARPAITLERHGSLAAAEIRKRADRCGLGMVSAQPPADAEGQGTGGGGLTVAAGVGGHHPRAAARRS